jgi:hypothetical protein
LADFFVDFFAPFFAAPPAFLAAFFFLATVRPPYKGSGAVVFVFPKLRDRTFDRATKQENNSRRWGRPTHCFDALNRTTCFLVSSCTNLKEFCNMILRNLSQSRALGQEQFAVCRAVARAARDLPSTVG